MKNNTSHVSLGQPNIFNYSDESISAYDTFLKNWREFVAKDGWQHSSNDDHLNIEKFAVETLSRLVAGGDVTSLSQGSLFFNSLHNSAIICDASGIVIKVNKQAMLNHTVSPGVKIDSLNMVLDNGVDNGLESGLNIASKLQEVLAHNDAESYLSLIQCRIMNQEVAFPLAMMPLARKAATAEESASPQSVLLIFMDAACNTDTIALFSVKFSLTKAEADVASAFSSGISLKDIAKTRHRSYATIRNQFQSVLEKTGCQTQADLLRMLLGISYLLSFAEVVSEAEHTKQQQQEKYGKKIEVMRPRGRFVDVRLYGDLEGKPFIMLPSLFGMPITPSIEAQLRSRSLLMIGVWRPGFAGSSKQHDSDDYYQCVADDITAVLDNIGVKQCPFMGRASAARTMFNLARIMPERISAACVVNSLVPLPYVTKYKIVSRWTKALVRAFEYSPSLAVLILETGRRLLVREGGKQFIKKMYKKSPPDLLLVSEPEVVTSLHQGALLGCRQGFLAPTQDMIDGFKDWSADVKKSKIQVALLQGRNDPNISIDASRDFAEHFPDQVALIELSDGGGLLNYSHSKAILDWVEESF